MKWDSLVVLFNISFQYSIYLCSVCVQSWFSLMNMITTDINGMENVGLIASVFVCSEQVRGRLMLEALDLTGRQWKLLRICYNNSLIRQKQEVDKQYLLSGFLLEASTFVVGPSPKTGTLPCQSYFHFDAEQHSSLVRGSLRAFCQNTLWIALNLFK